MGMWGSTIGESTVLESLCFELCFPPRNVSQEQLKNTLVSRHLFLQTASWAIFVRLGPSLRRDCRGQGWGLAKDANVLQMIDLSRGEHNSQIYFLV